MCNDRKIDVSFSTAAEGVIRRFMKVAEETMTLARGIHRGAFAFDQGLCAGSRAAHEGDVEGGSF